MLEVTAQEVIASLPPGVPEPPTQYVEGLIRQAITRLYMQVPNLDAIIDVDDRNDRKTAYARDMIIAAVRRVVVNPAAAQGYRSESEGNYSYSLSSALDASASIWFPDKDLALLVKRRPSVGVIHMTRPRRDW